MPDKSDMHSTECLPLNLKMEKWERDIIVLFLASSLGEIVTGLVCFDFRHIHILGPCMFYIRVISVEVYLFI